MAYVITDPCVGTCDAACVAVCPVDCIHGPIPLRELELVPRSQRAARFPALQLYIDADLCICCGACEPECPVEAIYDEDQVPARFAASAARAAEFFARRTT